MKFDRALKNFFIVLVSALILSACSTAKKGAIDTVDDVYTGTDSTVRRPGTRGAVRDGHPGRRYR